LVDQRIKEGPPLVSANFVIPYPPVSIMVPGRVIGADTVDFMRKLDVKEIQTTTARRCCAGCARLRSSDKRKVHG
jgi:arginine decarboxylase